MGFHCESFREISLSALLAAAATPARWAAELRHNYADTIIGLNSCRGSGICRLQSTTDPDSRKPRLIYVNL